MPRRIDYPDHFNAFWKNVWTPGRRLSGDSKAEGFKAYEKSLREGSTIEEISQGTEYWFELQRRKKASGDWAQSPPHLCRFLARELHHDAYEALQDEKESLEHQKALQGENVVTFKRGQTAFLKKFKETKQLESQKLLTDETETGT